MTRTAAGKTSQEASCLASLATVGGHDTGAVVLGLFMGALQNAKRRESALGTNLLPDSCENLWGERGSTRYWGPLPFKGPDSSAVPR